MSNAYIDSLLSRFELERMKPGFGNARTVRNIVEQSIRMQSARIAKRRSPSREDLILLTESDVPPVAESLKSEKEVLLQSLEDVQKRLREIELRELIHGLRP